MGLRAALAAWATSTTMFVNAHTNDVPQDNGRSAGGLAKFTTFQHKSSVRSHAVNYNYEGRDNEDDDDDDDDEDDPADDPADDDAVLHQPSGQHLLVDMKNVDPQFLNSEDRLAQAMIDLVEESKVTLLSYHCHSRTPMGVSCAGVLLESHVSFHTWPAEGAIIMDMFTCGDYPLIPLLPTIEKLFALPASNNIIDGDEKKSEPRMTWSHKRRGFREGFDPEYEEGGNPLDQDISIDLLRKHDLDMKVPLMSADTAFQYVDVYEVIDPRLNSLGSYEKSLSNDGSYESLHPDLYKPDKLLFLDGVNQSSLRGKTEYHEALVHPAMIAHPNPKRVAIVGGGEGATLREALVHNTVELVKMVEIDGELVDMCREYLPEYSDCSDIEGSDADSCFDDSRAEVTFEDAFAWFMDNFVEADSVKKEDTFDVIIMDALDPEKMVQIAATLYQDNLFVDSLFNALSEDGAFVVQLGQSDDSTSPGEDEAQSKHKFQMMEALKEAGFKSMHIYDEGHAHYEAPWTILVAFKDLKSRARWYRSAAEIEIELHRRLHRTKSGKSPINFFDGPTMLGYQAPSKATQIAYCRNAVTPRECDMLPEGANGKAPVVMNGKSNELYILPSTWSVINNYTGTGAGDNNAKTTSIGNELNRVTAFAEGYGHDYNLLGEKQVTVGKSCYEMYNTLEEKSDLTEATIYSPVVERHLRQILTTGSNCVGGKISGDNIE